MVKVDVIENEVVEVKTSGTVIRTGTSTGKTLTFFAEIDGVSYPVDNLVDSEEKLTKDNYFVDLNDSEKTTN